MIEGIELCFFVMGGYGNVLGWGWSTAKAQYTRLDLSPQDHLSTLFGGLGFERGVEEGRTCGDEGPAVSGCKHSSWWRE